MASTTQSLYISHAHFQAAKNLRQQLWTFQSRIYPLSSDNLLVSGHVDWQFNSSYPAHRVTCNPLIRIEDESKVKYDGCLFPRSFLLLIVNDLYLLSSFHSLLMCCRVTQNEVVAMKVLSEYLDDALRSWLGSSVASCCGVSRNHEPLRGKNGSFSREYFRV